MSRLPVNQPYTITTQFGVPDSNARFGRHSGIDYAVPLNRPVYAPASGTLTNIKSVTGGNMVQIFDGQYYHRLMHNNSFSRSDGRVNEGDEVAKAGTTGLSTGVHSHWDVASQASPTAFSQFIDPNIWLKEEEEVAKPTQKEVLSQFRNFKVRGALGNGDPSQAQLDYYSSHDWGTLNGDLLNAKFSEANGLQAIVKELTDNESDAAKKIAEVKAIVNS